MFGMPLTTEYDAKFQLLGIPVRIHPLFWVMAAVLSGWKDKPALLIVEWIACVFISILVHEFGHALTTRRAFHQRPWVLLYLMGGLCISDGDQRHPWKRALVLIMGPGAGFLLFGLVLGVGLAVLGVAEVYPFGLFRVHDVPRWFFQLPEWLGHLIESAYFDMLFINLFWGLFNLLPIYPLDGGQLANVFLTMYDRYQGAKYSHILGMITAGLVSVYFFSANQQYNGFFALGLVFLNYQLYQAARYQQSAGYQFEDDDQWWRK